MSKYSKGPPIRNFTYKKGCTMFCGRWLRKFVQGKRVGFLATMVLLLCGRQHLIQPLPIGPGRAVEVIVHFDAQLIQDGASTLLAEARHPFCCHFRRKESPLEQRNLPFLAGQSQRKLPTSGR